MNIKGFFPLILALALVVAGCGGTSSDKSSSLTFDMAVLQVEGPHIRGIVYDDLNGDGVMDAGEPGLSGVTVTLVGVESTFTDALGQYAFGDIAAGAYTVVETDPVGFVSTTPNTVFEQVSDVDVVAVTAAPGLPGSLLVGRSFANAISFAAGIPLVDVNHLHAHVFSCFHMSIIYFIGHMRHSY